MGMMKLWILFMILGHIQMIGTNTPYNPHEPMIWRLTNEYESKVVREYRGSGSDWNFTVDLFSLNPFYQWCQQYDPSCQKAKDEARCKAFYMCPASNPGKGYCNAPGHYFCAYWGCETIASDWKTKGDPYIEVNWGPPGCMAPKHANGGQLIGKCEPPRVCWRIEIKVKNPGDPSWELGRTWGIRYWEPGTDGGSVFRIIKQKMPYDKPIAIGPNEVLNTFSKEQIETTTQIIAATQNSEVTGVTEVTTSALFGEHQEMITEISDNSFSNSLWNTMHAAYIALNNSQPNLTNECWLCYSIRPPFYEAIGNPQEVQWKNGTNPIECQWNNTQGITLQQVTGKGKCIGTVPKQYKALCNNTISKEEIETKNKSVKWMIPAKGAKWVCSNIGVTPCISLKIFDPNSHFCVQVIVVPRLMYHSDEEVMYQMENGLKRQKREPLTVITLATLLVAGGVGAGTGIASLVKTDEIQDLQRAVDEDLERIEQSIDNLAKSVKSLSEVVLQNRRGLDLLFLKEGGLCVALQEECCSFVDHTGMVRDSMAELKKRLEKRKRDRDLGKTWYEGWFNASPWLTSLLSAVAGPVILIMTICLLGPCILKCLTNFIEKRFETTKLLTSKNKYKDEISLAEYKNGTNI